VYELCGKLPVDGGELHAYVGETDREVLVDCLDDIEEWLYNGETGGEHCSRSIYHERLRELRKTCDAAKYVFNETAFSATYPFNYHIR